MDNEIKNLTIRSVNLRISNMAISIDFDPAEGAPVGALVQSYRNAEAIKLSELLSEDEEKFSSYDILYKVGIRLINEEDKDLDDGEEVQSIMEISAVFEARYISSIAISSEAIERFSEKNVGYHVWPYWREHVQSMCGKAGFAQGFQIPFYFA